MKTALAILVGALLTSACGEAMTTPTAPSTVTTVTDTWTGSLSVGASRFYSFRVSQGGTVAMMLASVTSPANGAALAPIMEIGFGIPAGTGCAATTSLNVTPALQAQLQTSSEPGVYCIRVADIGNLSGPVNFAVRFTHP